MNKIGLTINKLLLQGLSDKVQVEVVMPTSGFHKGILRCVRVKWIRKFDLFKAVAYSFNFQIILETTWFSSCVHNVFWATISYDDDMLYIFY